MDSENPITFLINKDKSLDSLVLRYFDLLLINKYNNYIFYIYNLGDYNGLFILKILR